MAGNYQTKSKEYSKFIRNWIDKAIQDKYWEKLIDLHIDNVDEVFKDSHNWISGSLFLLERFVENIDKSKYEVLLAISLLNSNKRINKNSLNLESMEKSLDNSPPSFYLFPKTDKNFIKTIEKAEIIDHLSTQLNYKVYLMEKKDAEEYFGVIYILA